MSAIRWPVSADRQNPRHDSLRIADCGLRIADCGLRIARPCVFLGKATRLGRSKTLRCFPGCGLSAGLQRDMAQERLTLHV